MTAAIPFLLLPLLAETSVPVGVDPVFLKQLAALEETRQQLSTRFAAARNEPVRAKIRNEARRHITHHLLSTIVPAWVGTPWFMGEDDDASLPHQAGKRVSCSNFVTAALQNVGFRFDNRRRWAEAPALFIQRSLAPAKQDLHRFFGLPPKDLERALSRWEHGLYVVGLNCHVGFISIEPRGVWFIHSDYMNPDLGVRREGLDRSQAIENSREAGYWITPLLSDDATVDRWLRGEPQELKRLGQIRSRRAASTLPKAFWAGAL